jgi:hypothetical protein
MFIASFFILNCFIVLVVNKATAFAEMAYNPVEDVTLFCLRGDCTISTVLYPEESGVH